MYSVVMKASELVCVNLIPLDYVTLVLGALTFGMFVHPPMLDVLASRILMQSWEKLGVLLPYDMVSLTQNLDRHVYMVYHIDDIKNVTCFH